MTDEMETIEAEVVETVENLPAVREPGTLFRTDDPALIVEKATAIANALAGVLKAKNLTKRIGNRDFVQVEGWTLCGSMLGVFAVIEWTRQLENGWEARAVAKTLAGAEVGAAEAECLRSEKSWANRDDYALRSMAQTRAVSKALRAPLGFVIQLAGFEATPADEIPPERPQEAPGAPETARRESGPAPFPIPTSWPKVEKAIRECDNPDEAWALWQEFLKEATYMTYGKKSLKEISTDERKVMLQKAAGAAVWLHENAEPDGAFVYFDQELMCRAWSAMLKGTRLEIPDYTPPEPPIPEAVDEEIERISAEF